MIVLSSFYRLPILVFMLFASFISCLPSEPEDEGVRAFNQHIFNLHFYNLQTEDIIEIIKSLHGQQGSVHYHGVGIGAPDSPTSSSSSSSSSTNQQPGGNDNNDVIDDDDDDGNGREGSVRDSNDVKVSDRQTETGVDSATLPTSSGDDGDDGDDGDSNDDDEISNDFTPIELTKARQKADEYVEQVRSELCPICIATVPVQDRRTSETQEAQLLQFLVRNNPSRRNRYNLFEKVRKALNKKHKNEYFYDSALMTADATEVCTAIVTKEINRRLLFQVRTSNSETKREIEKGAKDSRIRTPALRAEGYKIKMESSIANNEVFSCEGFDEIAAKLEKEFRKIMGSD